MTAGSVAVRCLSVRIAYPTDGEDVVAIANVSASFERGRLTAVAGASGAGKSSLLRAIAGAAHPTAGEIIVGGRNVARLRGRGLRRYRRHEVAYISAEPSENVLPDLTAEEHIAFATAIDGNSLDSVLLLESVGLRHVAHRYPASWSGGEQQRLAIAMAAARPHVSLVVADEPTSQLDSRNALIIADFLHETSRTGTAVIVGTHDAALLARSDKVLYLRQGHLFGGD